MPAEDDRFQEVLKGRIEIQLRGSKTTYQEKTSAIKRQANASGALRSGNTIKQLVDSAVQEHRDRCNKMAGTLSEVWTSFEPPVPQANIASGIVRHIAQASSEELYQSILADPIVRVMGGTPGSLSDQLREGLHLSTTELSLVLDTWEASIKNAKNAEQVRQRTVVNLTGNHNIVQAGTVASSLQVNLSTDNKENLRDALTKLREEILQSKAFSESQRRDHVELVVDCLQEIEREEPNKLRLGGALQAVATSIQTIGAAGPAYEAVKMVANLMGIALP